MPTLQSMDLPKPETWQEFETLVRDALKQTWGSPTLAKNGRGGQKQAGVDIYGSDDLGRSVGIQCKRFTSKLTLKTVTKEIANAEKFKGSLSTLYLATTADRDAPLQQAVRSLSETRALQGKFAIGILYWDDIVAGLVQNPAVFRAHYPNLHLPTMGEVDRNLQIAALELGYFGAGIWDFAQLVFGEVGQMAGQDEDEFFATLTLLRRRVQQILPPEDAVPILKALKKTERYTVALTRTPRLRLSGKVKAKTARGTSRKPAKARTWDEVKTQARRASKRISHASSLLPMELSNVLDLGAQLGRIYHHVDDRPEPNLQAQIRTKVEAVLPAASAEAVEERFAAAATLSSGYNWARRIFSLIDNEIRYCQ